MAWQLLLSAGLLILLAAAGCRSQSAPAKLSLRARLAEVHPADPPWMFKADPPKSHHAADKAPQPKKAPSPPPQVPVCSPKANATRRAALPLEVMSQRAWWAANEHSLPRKTFGHKKPATLDEKAQALRNLAEPEYFCYASPCGAQNATEVRLEATYMIAAASAANRPKLHAQKFGGLRVEESVDDASRWRLVVRRTGEKGVRIQNSGFPERFLALGDKCVDLESEEPDAGGLPADSQDAVWQLSPAPDGLFLLKQPRRSRFLVLTADGALGTAAEPSGPGALWAISPAPPADAMSWPPKV